MKFLLDFRKKTKVDMKRLRELHMDKVDVYDEKHSFFNSVVREGQASERLEIDSPQCKS